MNVLFKYVLILFFFSSRRRHTRYWRDWSSDVCSSDLERRLDDLARLADLLGVRDPPGVDRRPTRPDRAAECLRDLLEECEPLGPADPAPARHDDPGVIDGHRRALGRDPVDDLDGRHGRRG